MAGFRKKVTGKKNKAEQGLPTLEKRAHEVVCSALESGVREELEEYNSKNLPHLRQLISSWIVFAALDYSQNVDVRSELKAAQGAVENWLRELCYAKDQDWNIMNQLDITVAEYADKFAEEREKQWGKRQKQSESETSLQVYFDHMKTAVNRIAEDIAVGHASKPATLLM